MYNLIWSREELTTQKLGTFGEYYAKMELASYGMSIYTSEVDDHGIDFVAETQKSFLKFQVKSIRTSTTKYVFILEKNFDISDESLFLYLILLTDNEHPKSYIIPASAWKGRSDSKLFVYRGNYDKPEYGLNLSKKNIAELKPYSLENMVKNLS